MRARRFAVIVLVAASALASGCAKRVALYDIGSTDVRVGVVLTLASGEQIAGRLLGLEDGSVSVETLEADGVVGRRTVSLDGVSRMTFHRQRREAVFGPIVSLFLGPLAGALLALAL